MKKCRPECRLLVLAGGRELFPPIPLVIALVADALEPDGAGWYRHAVNQKFDVDTLLSIRVVGLCWPGVWGMVRVPGYECLRF